MRRLLLELVLIPKGTFPSASHRQFPGIILQPTMLPTLAIILEKTGTLTSPWVWGEEILAECLARHLREHFLVTVISEAEALALSPGPHYAVAVHFREKFPRIGRRNVLYLHYGLEPWHSGLTDDQWIDLCIRRQIPRFDIIASTSQAWCKIVERLGGRGLYFPQFADSDFFKVDAEKGRRDDYDIVYVSNNIKGEEVNREFLYPVLRRFSSSHRVALFGAGWDNTAEPKLIGAVHRGTLPPTKIAHLYSTSKVVLSLHLQSHRRFGVVTSRVYEALTCGAVIVSDTVDTEDPLLSSTCYTASSGARMIECIEEALQLTPEQRESHAERVKSFVTTHHSAARRAEMLVSALSAAD
jgi:Glycosyl transferases group 1